MNDWEPVSSLVEEPASLMTPQQLDEIKVSKPKKVRVKIEHDPVNFPAHYVSGGIETIEYIKAKLTPEEYIGYLKGNVIKYTSRAGKKADLIQDLEKAQWYMARQINELKGETK